MYGKNIFEHIFAQLCFQGLVNFPVPSFLYKTTCIVVQTLVTSKASWLSLNEFKQNGSTK